MSKEVGVWIDHEKAILAFVAGRSVETRIIASPFRQDFRIVAKEESKPPHGREDVIPERRFERKVADHMRVYFEQIAAALHDADAILLFGPGPARIEFHKYLDARAPDAPVVRVAPADKMAEPEVREYVRRYFAQRKWRTEKAPPVGAHAGQTGGPLRGARG